MSVDHAALEALAFELGRALDDAGLTLACAESCTGGWIAKCVTDIAGSSAWFDRGIVSYTNESKQELLMVQAATLVAHGAVSAATVSEMVSGALAASRADIAVAVSGIAGPGGGTADKPVGTVWIAWARRGEAIEPQRFLFDGDREQVRAQTVAQALKGLLARIA